MRGLSPPLLDVLRACASLLTLWCRMKAIQACNDVEQLRDMAMFLNQYFELPKGIIDIRERHVFFARLAASGLFDALLALLAFPDETIQLTT